MSRLLYSLMFITGLLFAFVLLPVSAWPGGGSRSELDQQLHDFARELRRLPEDVRRSYMQDLKDFLLNRMNKEFEGRDAFLSNIVRQIMNLGPEDNHLLRTMHTLLSILGHNAGSGSASNFIQSLMRHLQECKRGHTSKKMFFAVIGYWNYPLVKTQCQMRGGRLAVIENLSEAEKAWDAIQEYFYNTDFYVGHVSNPHFLKQTVPPMSNWAAPNYSSPNAKCAHIRPAVRNRFFVSRCRYKLSALCETVVRDSTVDKIGVKGFVYYKKPMRLSEAKATCAKIGGDLAIITKHSEQNEAHSFIANGGNRRAFIGAHRQNGVWSWRDGSRVIYRRWGHYRVTDRDNCAVMEGNIRFSKHPPAWRAVSCNSREAAMCEVQYIRDDLIRLTDRFAVGKYFVAHKELKTHYEAVSACGKGLAKIRGSEQYIAVMKTAMNLKAVHIGLTDRTGKGKFFWDDGTPLDGRLYKELIPASPRITKNLCVILTELGNWQVVSCEKKASYVCEEPYRKDATKPEASPHEFEMDVRMNVDFEEVSRTQHLKNNFVKAFEMHIARLIGLTKENVVVSNLKSGSTIVTFRVYRSGEPYEVVGKIKRKVKSGAFTMVFNGRRIHPTRHQSFNVKKNICIYTHPPRDKFRRIWIPIAVAILLLLLGLAVTFWCFVRKRHALRSRNPSVGAMRVVADEKKIGPPEDVLPPYDQVMTLPPYSPPADTPPPPYAPNVGGSLPDVKT